MRYALGFVCVLALAVMGCSEPSGTGGTAGDGGSGGEAGCLGQPCTIGEVQGVCCSDICFVYDCETFEDGTECSGDPKLFEPGLCEAGECLPTPQDCTGLEDGTRCAVLTDLACEYGECEAGECVTE